MEKQVNVLVVGEGGREFAVAKKLQESPRVKQVYCEGYGRLGPLNIDDSIC